MLSEPTGGTGVGRSVAVASGVAFTFDSVVTVGLAAAVGGVTTAGVWLATLPSNNPAGSKPGIKTEAKTPITHISSTNPHPPASTPAIGKRLAGCGGSCVLYPAAGAAT